MSTSDSSVDPAATARHLMRTVPLIVLTLTVDGHNDFAWMIRGWLQNRLDHIGDDTLESMPIGQTDLRRLREGHVGCQFWSAFVPCPSDSDSTESQLSILRTTLQQLDALHTMFQRYPGTFGYVDKSADILPVFLTGRIASLISIEGLHQIANSASVLRMYHRLGVRCATLCHDKNNCYCHSATSKDSVDQGLLTEGREMVAEMNRMGMMIDLSHTSHETQRDVLAVSRAPVIFSHSSCFALCPHRRNVMDEMLDMLQQNGGVIMLCFLPSLVDPSGGSNASLSQIADHIEYAGNRIGYSHVGIGSDFDGMLKGPKGMDDVSQYPELVAELVRRGVSEQKLFQLMGLNLIRVLAAVEETAERMKKTEFAILFDNMPAVWTEEQKSILVEAGKMRQAERR